MKNTLCSAIAEGYYVVQGHQGQYQSKARMRLPISD